MHISPVYKFPWSKVGHGYRGNIATRGNFYIYSIYILLWETEWMCMQQERKRQILYKNSTNHGIVVFTSMLMIIIKSTIWKMFSELQSDQTCEGEARRWEQLKWILSKNGQQWCTSTMYIWLSRMQKVLSHWYLWESGNIFMKHCIQKSNSLSLHTFWKIKNENKN